jgi:hypothetical protein
LPLASGDSNDTAKSPRMRGPEGRPPNVSPARKGLGINPEDDLSAVGAALNLDPFTPVSLGAYPNSYPGSGTTSSPPIPGGLWRIGRLRRTLPHIRRIGRLRRTLPHIRRIGRLRRTLPHIGRIGRLRRTLPHIRRIRRLRRTLPPRAASLLLVTAEDVFEGHHTLQDPLASPVLNGQNRPTCQVRDRAIQWQIRK